jgi:hypothetical protein
MPVTLYKQKNVCKACASPVSLQLHWHPACVLLLLQVPRQAQLLQGLVILKGLQETNHIVLCYVTFKVKMTGKVTYQATKRPVVVRRNANGAGIQLPAAADTMLKAKRTLHKSCQHSRLKQEHNATLTHRLYCLTCLLDVVLYARNEL